MDTCDRAIDLDLKYSSRRGVAKVLIGDIQAGIKDFQRYIDWTNNNKQFSPEQLKDNRLRFQKWIDELDQGKTPFTKQKIKEVYRL